MPLPGTYFAAAFNAQLGRALVAPLLNFEKPLGKRSEVKHKGAFGLASRAVWRCMKECVFSKSCHKEARGEGGERKRSRRKAFVSRGA